MKKLELKIPPPVVTVLTLLMICGLGKVFPDLYFEIPGRDILVSVLGLIGMVFGALGIMNFRIHKTTINPSKPENSSSLVTSGIYKITRNPMYCGLLLLLLAAFFYFSNLLGIIGPLFFVLYLTRFQIRPEEERLEAKFGQAYLDYKKKVRRWI